MQIPAPGTFVRYVTESQVYAEEYLLYFVQEQRYCCQEESVNTGKRYDLKLINNLVRDLFLTHIPSLKGKQYRLTKSPYRLVFAHNSFGASRPMLKKLGTQIFCH